MSGSIEDEGEYKLPYYQSTVELAKIAAPFAASGKSNREAIKAASDLLAEVDAFLMAQERSQIRKSTLTRGTIGLKSEVDLEVLYSHLKVRDLRQIRKYLIAAEGEESGARIWDLSMNGERVLTPEILGRMQVVKSEAIAKRNQANARNAKKG